MPIWLVGILSMLPALAAVGLVYLARKGFLVHIFVASIGIVVGDTLAGAFSAPDLIDMGPWDVGWSAVGLGVSLVGLRLMGPIG